MNFKRLLKGVILGLLIGVVIGGILSIFLLTDDENYTIKDNFSKNLYAILIISTLPIFLFGTTLGFINSLRKPKREKSKIISILKWIIAFIITIVLFINVVDILPEIKYKECIYVMDKISYSCNEAYKKWESGGDLGPGSLKDCACKTGEGIALFVGDEFYGSEVNEDDLKKECEYHKECKEVEQDYSPKKIEQYREKDLRNVNVVVYGPNVIRSGNQIMFRLLIKNVNKKTDIFIKNVKLLDSNKKVIENFEINTSLKPVGKEIISMNKMSSRINKSPFFYFYYMLAFYYDKNLEKIVNKIRSNSLEKSFREIDIRKYTSAMKVEETVTILIEIEVNYDDKSYIIKKEHSVLISEPLPGPPHD